MIKTPVDNAKISTMTSEQIFSEMLTRNIKAVMFHEQMSVLFGFIGLNGFKRMHEYQFVEESKGLLCLHKFYGCHYSKLIVENKVDAFNEIPNDWYKANKDNVTASIISQYTSKELSEYIAWEKETVAHLNAYAKRMIELSDMSSVYFIHEKIEEVNEELEYANKIYFELKANSFSVGSIQDIQHRIHKRFKKLMD